MEPLVRTADGDRSVVRMFSHRPQTVRWETRIVEGRGLELTVLGPGALQRAYAFGDATALVDYQVQRERQLLLSGYDLLDDSERRVDQDRRRYLRLAVDRRTR